MPAFKLIEFFSQTVSELHRYSNKWFGAVPSIDDPSSSSCATWWQLMPKPRSDARASASVTITKTTKVNPNIDVSEISPVIYRLSKSQGMQSWWSRAMVIYAAKILQKQKNKYTTWIKNILVSKVSNSFLLLSFWNYQNCHELLLHLAIWYI